MPFCAAGASRCKRPKRSHPHPTTLTSQTAPPCRPLRPARKPDQALAALLCSHNSRVGLQAISSGTAPGAADSPVRTLAATPCTLMRQQTQPPASHAATEKHALHIALHGLPACLPACLLACLPACLLACLPGRQHDEKNRSDPSLDWPIAGIHKSMPRLPYGRCAAQTYSAHHRMALAGWRITRLCSMVGLARLHTPCASTQSTAARARSKMRPAPLNPFGRAPRSVLFLCFLIACLQGLRWGASILARLLLPQEQSRTAVSAAPTAPARPMRR